MKPTITLILLSLATLSLAQVRISGKVVNDKGEPLIGANILLKDTYDGASTDANGNFSFTTDEHGAQILIVTSISFEPLEHAVDLSRNIEVSLTMKESFNELEAVEISAGSFTAGDEKRRTILRAVDIATTAGATADIAGALNTLPGTTKVGETGRLFVRGGDDSEARTFIDGMLVMNEYNASAPNTPSRTRFMPFMFKGTSFSTGGYSAEYGQALSSALILNSKDKAEMNQTDIGILSVGAEVAHTQVFEKSSVGGKISYTSLAPYYELIKQRLDWEEPYSSLDINAAYRQQLGRKGGMLKAYGKYNNARLSYNQSSIADPTKKYLYEINNEYAYGNLAMQTPLNERWSLRGGISFTHNVNDMRIAKLPMYEQENGVHVKLVTESSLNEKVEVRIGAETISRNYSASRQDSVSGLTQKAAFDEIITSLFGESEIYLSDRLVTRVGVRTEYNSLNRNLTVDPRVSLAYKPFDKGQVSFAYGIFRQSVKNEYLRINNDLNSERAEHFILNYQLTTDNRTFRVEAYYKKYLSLIKYSLLEPSLMNNNGSGYASGAEIFYRDNKSIRNADFWISYSFLNTKRDYLNFPIEATPSFASQHNFSVVYKHFITKLRSQIGATYSFASPRPYNNPNLEVFNSERTPAYHDLSANISYLPKSWIIVYASCTNLLGRNNIFGYEYSAVPGSDGVYAARAITQPAKHFMLVGVFLTISKNKSVNQLPNL
ncbi:TonB-dependent receptor [Chryseolinea sp. T2]|uniref:TonB-dependent receptor n=1 Tax=Chryseolinea sp. T2 TaxID=3129255 RepID=UPI00307819BE